MTKSRLFPSRPRTRSSITRTARSVRNTAEGEDTSDATDGSRRYEVEDPSQARRGSRSSSVESEEAGGSTDVYDSAADSVLGDLLQKLRLDSAADVARGFRPAALSAAGVGQEVPVQSGAGAPIQLAGVDLMGDQFEAAAISPPGQPTVTRPRKPKHDVDKKSSRNSFGPPRASSTPGSAYDSEDDAELFAADMSAAMQLKYAALRRQLHRARERGENQQVTLTQQLIAKLIESSMSSASTAAGSSSSGSVGGSSHVSEQLQVHVGSVSKEVATKIKAALKSATEELSQKHKSQLGRTTAPKKIQAVIGSFVSSVKAVLPPHGAKYAALLTIVGNLPLAWLLSASIGNADQDHHGDAVRSLQSVVTAVPVVAAGGLHPFTALQRAQRSQFQALLEQDPVLSAIDSELREVLLQVLAADLRDVTAVATAENCAVLLHNVLQQVNHHEMNQFTEQLATVNRAPPPLRPQPPYLVESALALFQSWYDYRVRTVRGVLAMSPEEHQFNLVLESLPTGDGQIGRVFDDLRSRLQAQLFSPEGGVRGHEANLRLLATLRAEHKNRQYTGTVILAGEGGGGGGTALLGYNPWQRHPRTPAKAVAKTASGPAAVPEPSPAAGKSASADVSADKAASGTDERRGRTGGRGKGGKGRPASSPPRSPTPQGRAKCMSGEVWNTEADCVAFASGQCSKSHKRLRCDKGAACSALKEGTCKKYHPRAEVLTVLGDPGSDKAKKYWRNLGLMATVSGSVHGHVQFDLKPAVAVLPSKALLRSAAPDVVDPALALGSPIPSASEWRQPAASVRRSSVRGFKFRMKEPLSKRRLKLALRQFSQVDPSRAWVQFSPEDRRALVLGGENLPERLAAIISSAEHHQVAVPASLRRAYDRVTEPIVREPTVDDAELELEASGSSIVLPASVVQAVAAIRPGASVVMLSQLSSDTVGVGDSGATVVLANTDRDRLHNVRALAPHECLSVDGIGGVPVRITEAAELVLAAPAVSMCGAGGENHIKELFSVVDEVDGSLWYYWIQPVYINPSLAPGLVIFAVGRMCRDSYMKFVVDGAPGAISYLLTAPQGSRQVRLAIKLRIGVAEDEEHPDDTLVTIPDLRLLPVGDKIADNLLDAACAEWARAEDWYDRAWSAIEHRRQVAALAAVSAAPVVYFARREEESESYSVTGSKAYGFLAFRSHLPDEEPDVVDDHAADAAASLPSDQKAAGAVVSDIAAGVALMGAHEVQSDVGVPASLGSSMNDVIRMGASAGVSYLDGIADTCLHAVESIGRCCKEWSSSAAVLLGLSEPAATAVAVPGSECAAPVSCCAPAVCYVATTRAESLSASPPFSARDKPFLRPKSGDRTAALVAGRSPAFERRLEVLRGKLAALKGPVVVVDVCSGKDSFSAALIPEFPNVHVLNYDKTGPDPQYLGWRTPGNASRHAHVSGDVRKLTKARIGADAERHWGLTWDNIVFVNLAPNCRNVSTAPEFGSHPLREGPAGGWAARTDDSVADDELREWCFKLFHDIDVEEQGRVAVVFEHPAYGYLFDLPFVQGWMREHEHVVVSYADACLLTFRSDGSWPRKSTVFITTPNVDSFELDCHGSCQHMLRGRGCHKCIIAPRSALQPGQVRVTDSRMSRYSKGHVCALLAFAELRLGPGASASTVVDGSALHPAVCLASCGGLPSWEQPILTAKQFHEAAGHYKPAVLLRTARGLKDFQLRLPDGSLKSGSALTLKDLQYGPCDTCILSGAQHAPSKHTNNAKVVKDLTPEQRQAYHKSLLAATAAP